MPNRSESVDGSVPSTDGHPAKEAAAEISRLTLYADEQARKVEDLQVTVGQLQSALDSRVLTDLYGAPVFVLRAGNRLVVVGAPDAEESHHHHAHDHDEAGE